ncbi:hypothetical protein ACU4GD_38355 [Cupriavidus basilensis]
MVVVNRIPIVTENGTAGAVLTLQDAQCHPPGRPQPALAQPCPAGRGALQPR